MIIYFKMTSIISCAKCSINTRILNTPTFNFIINPIRVNYFSIQSSTLLAKRKFTLGMKSEVETDGEFLNKGDRIFRARLKSLRIDAVLKSGLQMSRKLAILQFTTTKIEKAFYQDKIRVNGLRPKKKSQLLDEGEEVDIIREFNKENPKFLDVSRVEVQKLDNQSDDETDENDDSDSDSEAEDGKFSVILKKYRLLTVENYDEPWKGVDED